MSERITITLNGNAHTVDAAMTILAFLTLHDLEVARGIAVELNGEVVPKQELGQRTLQANDVLEVVSFVGGG